MNTASINDNSEFSSNVKLFLENALPLPNAAMERKGFDTIEICYLIVIVFFGTILNITVFFQLMRQSK